MPNQIELCGRITRLNIGDDYAAEFRINGGSVVCRATGELALQIIEKRGYPNHNLRVFGNRQDGRKIVLAVDGLVLVD